ncbi:alkaline phosphatase-like [Glandiceps talaboti]
MKAEKMNSVIRVCLVCLIAIGINGQPPEEWIDQAEEALSNALKLQKLNTNVAKNVLFFIGDGMGVATVSSARILKGQLKGNTGEETVLHMETLPHVALSKTYNTNQQVADSAGTATAFLSGVKTKAAVIGVHDGIIKGDCLSSKNSSIDSVFKLAQDAGKSIGIVSTTRLTHATPAAVYAHSADRVWENNNKIPIEQRIHGCKDIALQLVEGPGKDIKVLLGGGRREFFHITYPDPEYMTLFGRRTDDRNLIEEWLENRPLNSNASYVWNQEQFDKIDPEHTDYLLGLFENSHMQYHANRDQDGAGEPTIAEMVKKAIKILEKNKNGFFLLVEGGRIDHSHHNGVAYHALMDTIAFDDAVAAGMSLTSDSDTLTIVTADHSHVNTIAGYPSRGNPILGINDKETGRDGLPFTTIMYADGPGAKLVLDSLNVTGQRPNASLEDTESKLYVQQALVPRIDESHGGEDVAIYAQGPMAHLFHGVQEQHYIAHVIKYAACLRNNDSYCKSTVYTYQASKAATINVNSLKIFSIGFITFLHLLRSLNIVL